MNARLRLHIAGITVFVLAASGLWANPAAQEVIENSRKPAAAAAGRTLALQEIWSVSDDSGEFFFKSPRRLRAATDGTIFLWDEEELLKFNADGTFVRNLFNGGAGPGEMSSGFSYLIDGQEIVIYDGTLNRLWRMDLEGRFLRDCLLPDRTRRSLFGVWNDNLIFYWEEPPGAGGQIPGFTDFPQLIAFVSMDGTLKSQFPSFTFRRYRTSPGGGMNWGNSIEAQSEDGRFIYGFHGREYLIEVLDLERKTIVRRFTRDYPRVADPETPEQRAWRENMKLPRDEYKSDITGLMPNGPRLWARTSTEDAAKGELWDVFDADGRYVDCFFLGARRTLLRADGEILFVLEQNEDGTYRLVKYRITG